MRLQVNGKPMELDPGTTVSGLIERLGLRTGSVVVERNGEPLPRAAYPSTELVEGDVLEVVRPVQGGAGDAREGLARARLYLVCPGTFPVDQLQSAVEAGVDLVQLRDKDAEAVRVIAAGEPIRDLCRRKGVPFIVNDRPDIALALEADGVHLGQDDLPPTVARRIVGPQSIIGRSTHTTQQIAEAVREHEQGFADYIAVGPVHPTPTKPGRPPVGYELLRYAALHATMPWFAIGGIDPSNVRETVEAGAQRIVVVRAITLADDPGAAAKSLREALR